MIPIAKPVFGDEEFKAVKEVLASGFVVQGKRVEEFETEFANYLKVIHGIAVANGTIALDVALKAVGIKQGDEVIVPDFTFISTANSILFQGAKPIFADVDERTFNLNPSDVLEKITSKTKAIIGVHLFGHPFDIEAIQEICEDYSLTLIEDCAQAHGAEVEGSKVGSFGSIGCFSFYATKNMTTGEGGMITTDDDEIAKVCRLLRNHGESRKYNHTTLGYNYRMTEIQAAIGLAQLQKLEVFNNKRIRNAAYFNTRLKASGLKKPYKKEGVKHVYHQYAITIDENGNFPLTRDEFARHLENEGVGCAIHYPVPIHKQPLYQELGYTDENVRCPVATALSKKILSLPVHPALSEEDLIHIAEAINNLNGK